MNIETQDDHQCNNVPVDGPAPFQGQYNLAMVHGLENHSSTSSYLETGRILTPRVFLFPSRAYAVIYLRAFVVMTQAQQKQVKSGITFVANIKGATCAERQGKIAVPDN
ncbi:hypothetical protein QVD17_20257 [Tagetes erecta]|uniref:Uncharacterized protein n=1 Tax=Tagetes erecta TaxID=13708 RepID=A0AAD8KPL4_TARER|nr:hypothetical protein QVD17_20257 [Tagetes erecta]